MKEKEIVIFNKKPEPKGFMSRASCLAVVGLSVFFLYIYSGGRR